MSDELLYDRALHKLFRAIHDGICPNCGLGRSSRLNDVCGHCHFGLTRDEISRCAESVSAALKRDVDLIKRERCRSKEPTHPRLVIKYQLPQGGRYIELEQDLSSAQDVARFVESIRPGFPAGTAFICIDTHRNILVDLGLGQRRCWIPESKFYAQYREPGGPRFVSVWSRADTMAKAVGIVAKIRRHFLTGTHFRVIDESGRCVWPDKQKGDD